MGSFKSHSFKKNMFQLVAVIVNKLLQADSDISHYSVKHIIRYAGLLPGGLHPLVLEGSWDDI